MSQELVQKKIRISSKTLAGINQLIEDYEIENESALYRQFIEIGFALKKKQLDGDIGSGSEYLHIDASKQTNYHTQLLEVIAMNVGNITSSDLEIMKQSTVEYNHQVLANVKEFHKVDKENVKILKDNN